MRYLFLFICGLVLSGHAAGANVPSPREPGSPLTIFVAKKIITMEPSLPEATAVAVADGRIVAVGSEKSLQGWLQQRGGEVDRRFSDKILLPGLIDPHVHPSLPAILTQFPFIAPEDWDLPTGFFPGVTTPEAFEARLKELVAAHRGDPQRDPTVPFIAWGYHSLWHGEIYRQQLNQWFPGQPVMLWHRSFHEVVANDAALELLGMTEDAVGQHAELDWERGHFWENGLTLLLPRMPFLQAPERYMAGLRNFVEMLHHSGVTTAMDMGMGIFGSAGAEESMIRQVMEGDEAPARLVLTPIITDFLARGVSPEEALEEMQQRNGRNSRRVMYDNHFKLMMDGAIFSGLAQFAYPGYMDGHQGQWMAPRETTYIWAETFWDEGYQLHAHTNGDASAAALVELVRRLQSHRPRVDHRTTLEHFAYATEDQARQMHALGMLVSANPYYQYILADIYAERWLGPDRARNMVPLGALQRAGVRFALHSDTPMAPLSPLTLVWAAVNRQTINGNDNASAQKVSVRQALRAVTIDAAWVMRREDQIGSIRAGKMADFAVLEQDPYSVEPQQLKDIKIWGTVFEGTPYPVEKAAASSAPAAPSTPGDS